MTISLAVRTGAHNNSTTSSTTCVATTTGLTAGNYVVIGVGFIDTAGTTSITSVVDSLGHTYSSVGAKVRNASQTYSVQFFHRWVTTGSGSTVTFTATQSVNQQFMDIKIEEVSSSLGSWTASGVNTVMTGGTGNSTALATSAATPSKNNCAIFCYGGANSGTITAGSGFTLRTTGADGLGLADLVQTTAASKAGLLTTSVSSQWTITAFALEEPSTTFDPKKASQFLSFFH